MNILFITAFPPNSKTGGQTFSLNAINELSQKHAVDVLYFGYGQHKCEIVPNANIHFVTELKIHRFDFVRKFWMHPVFTRRFNKSALRFIQSLADKYDILYFDFSQVSLYSLFIDHPYKILRMHDVLCQKFGRKNALICKWVCRMERKILKSFKKIFVPSQKDVKIVKEQYGINSFYTNEYLKKLNVPACVEQKNRFVFYGYWKRAENRDGLVWFARNVFPLLKRRHNFIVIGGGLDDFANERYLKPCGMRYLGFVENPLEIILQSKSVIVPLFQGAGIKIKTIDSFSVGTPVIGTALAFEGLPNIEKLCHQADDAQKMAETIDSFIPLSFEQKKEQSGRFRAIYDNHHLLEQI